MSSIYDEYAILQAMVKLYLLNEYASNDRTITSVESYEYFKNYATLKKNYSLPTQTHSAPIHETKTSPPPPELDSIKKKKDEPMQPLIKSELLPEAEHTKERLVLNPLGKAVGIDLTDIRKRFVENFPGHPVLEAASAEKMRANDPQIIKVVVVAFSEKPTHLIFLNNLSKAINNSLCPSTLIQSNDIKPILESSELRILIAQEKELLTHAYLSQEIERLRQKNVAIIFLSPIEDYLLTPKLKVQLWHKIKSLCV